MDQSSIMQSLNTYAQKVCEYLSPEQIVLYGSYAKGYAHEDSDIDVAVIVKDFHGDHLKTASLLHRLCWDIDTRIEPVLLYADGKDLSCFLQDVRQTGRVIYQKAG